MAMMHQSLSSNPTFVTPQGSNFSGNLYIKTMKRGMAMS